MSQYLPLPSSTQALLGRYKVLSRESVQPNLMGGQLMRRKGESLEFREFVPYQPGDDIRFVDWRASARYGFEHELLVRSFAAEERMRLVVSIDPRATMRLPHALSKLQIALWLASAFATVANGDDEVYLHWLFASRAVAPTLLRASGMPPAPPPPADTLNLNHLDQILPPATIWVVISDLYFPPDRAAITLASMLAATQARMCWVLLIELDSWQHEQALMGKDIHRVTGPGAPPQLNRVQLTGDNRDIISKKIDRHRDWFHGLTQLDQIDHLRWDWWPQRQIDPESFFNTTFTGEKRIRDLFTKQNV